MCVCALLRVPVEFGAVGVPPTDALVPQLAHKDLQGEEGQHAQAEDDERHDFQQLAHGFEQSVDDGA